MLTTTLASEGLATLPTLESGLVFDLKISTDKVRVWLNRVDGTISAEQMVEGQWKEIPS